MQGMQFVTSIDEDGKVHVSVEDFKNVRKDREFKGKSANKHIDNYCILDLETTGICINTDKIIEISVLKVRKNEVVEEFSTLVNPQCHIPKEATAINHITDDMIKDAPVLDAVLDEFLSFVGEDVILGYNNAGFDMNLIYDSVLELRNRPFANDYLDIYHAVRRSLPELNNARLETVCKHYGLDTIGEHRALKDCYITKSCYDRLFAEFGDTAFKKRSYYFSGRGMQYSLETMALQELKKLLGGILCDGEITADEVDSLRFWAEEHRDFSDGYPFDVVFNTINSVLEDGIITEQEKNNLKNIFNEIVDPVKTCGCHEQIDSMEGKYVCITGDFCYGARATIEQLIISSGAIVDKSVKKATNYVVVGTLGSEAWKAGNYGAKIQKAMELKGKGLDIKIIEENEFIPAILKLIRK